MMQQVLQAISSFLTTLNRHLCRVGNKLAVNITSYPRRLIFKMQPSDFTKKYMGGNTVYTVSGVISDLLLLRL